MSVTVLHYYWLCCDVTSYTWYLSLTRLVLAQCCHHQLVTTMQQHVTNFIDYLMYSELMCDL